MKRLAPWILIAALLPPTAFADSFDDAAKAMDQQWDQYSDEMDRDWQKYSNEMDQAWNRYNAEIESTWGPADKKVPSKKEWVSYSDQRDQRSSIDFEKGELKVEVMIEPNASADSKQVKERLKTALEKIIIEPASEDKSLKVDTPFDAADIIHPAPVYPLQGQLELSNKQTVNKQNAVQFANEIVTDKTLKSKIIQTPQGKKQVVSISVSLIANHVKKRAMPYLKRVQEMAHRYNIPPSLIFGIMQTESYFNPMSRSAVPAYGLMQLVPRSGGLDAYEYVFKTKKILPAEYLYNAENNIELGSAYLKLLQIREMRRIKDPATRMLCAIAAYNTGGGNVAKAFIPGSHSIKRASAIINTMTYEEVYEYLRTHLPYEETQRYVMKVRKHMKNFAKLD